jgi:6-phosphogluconolactonase
MTTPTNQKRPHFNMKLHIFNTQQDWIGASVEAIVSSLSEQSQRTGEADLAVSGGSTPFDVYRELASQDLDFSKIDLIQVDERYVPETSAESNWSSIEKSFEGVNFRQTIRFEYSPSIQETLDQAQQNLPPKLGLTILGMGLDGHFASLFADGEYWDNLVSDKALITQAPANYPTRDRLSLSPEYIYNSEKIIILIKGKDKYNKLQEYIQNPIGIKNWPLEYLYNHPNLEVYCIVGQ